MPRHKFTAEECQRGGITRAQQPSLREAGLKGRDTTAERHGVQALFAIIKRGKR